MKKDKIILYGFEKIGFKLNEVLIEKDNYSFEVLTSTDLDASWETAKGLIIISSIFETYHPNRAGMVATYNSNVLSVIENHLYNMTKRGAWVCFLLVNDLIKTDNNGDITNYDLSKKIITQIGFSWSNMPTFDPVLTWKFDEFKTYIQKYGMRKTKFYELESNPNISIISEENGLLTAFEAYKKIYFLPFKPTSNKSNHLTDVTTLIADSIKSYILKTSTSLPEWTKEFRLEREDTLINEIEQITQKLKSSKDDLESISKYKLLLTTSGENLTKIGIKVLEDEFGYEIDPIDNGLEDAKIVDGQNVLALIEFKGTNKGIKREYINQVDSHRERNNISSSCPGLLIINTKMKANSLEQKIEETIPKEHIIHAAKMNVVIIRTIDLLRIVKLNELRDQKISILEVASHGGGFLQFEDNEVKLLNETSYGS